MLWCLPCNLFVGCIFFFCHGHAQVISTATVSRGYHEIFDTPLLSEEESITCYGELPSWIPERKRYGRTLAAFCAEESEAYCYRDRGPTTIAFDILLKFEWDRREYNENQPNGPEQQDVNRPVVQDGEFYQLYREAEMCQIKCRCSDPAEQFNMISRQMWLDPAPFEDVDLVNGFRQEVWEWNFDRHDLLQRTRPRTQKAWWKIGLISKVGSEILDQDEPRLQYYTGSSKNRPTCFYDRLSSRLLSRLASHTIEHYASYAELCLHRYYGGNNFTNAGGICRKQTNNRRQLEFPWELQAPIFTSSLIVDRQCRRVCWCYDPTEDGVQEGQGENQLGWPLFLPVADREPETSYGNSDKSEGAEDASSSVSGSGLIAGQGDSASLQLKAPLDHPICSPKIGCDGPSTCGELCQCRAFLSIDPVMGNPQTFFGRCAVIASIAAAMQGLEKSKLGGRSLRYDEKGLGKMRSDMACPCNQSYVSKACCESPDGQVWEHPALKLGILEL